MFLSSIVLGLGLIAFIICQWLLPALARYPQSVWFLRLLLIGVGLALGLVYASYYPEVEAGQRYLLIVSAIGLVHIPAAAVLLIKRASHRKG